MLYVPLNSSDGVLEIPLELPEEADTLVKVLQQEMAPLGVWLRIAIEYHRRGMPSEVKKVIEAASEPDFDAQPNEWDRNYVRLYQGSKADRVAVLNARSAVYINLKAEAGMSDLSDSAGDYRNQATRCVHRADEIAGDKGGEHGQYHPPDTWGNTFVAKALLKLTEGKMLEASSFLDDFDDQMDGASNVCVKLTRACGAYKQQNYEEALSNFRMALEAGNPAMMEAIYVGIGMCCIKLNEASIARAAFNRVIQIGNDSSMTIRARIGLAIVELNSMKMPTTWVRSEENFKKAQIQAQDAMENAWDILIDAAETDDKHPQLLNLMANISFWREDFEHCKELAAMAYDNSSSNQCRAQSCYLIAKCYHIHFDYKNAQDFYSKATNLWPDFALAQFGLGQMHLWRVMDHESATQFWEESARQKAVAKERNAALICLERVRKTFPEHNKTLTLLAYLHSCMGKHDEAHKVLSKATNANPRDVDAWILLGNVARRENLEEAKNAYQKAVELIREGGGQPPFELCGNIAILMYKMGNPEEACHYLEGRFKALKLATRFTSGKNPKIKKHQVTMYFNLARMKEEIGESKAARKLYEKIVTEYPDQLQCKLRIGLIYLKRGRREYAKHFFKEVQAKVDSEKDEVTFCDACSLLAETYLLEGQSHKANENYRKIYKRFPNDGYNLVSLGNLSVMSRKKHDFKRLQNASKWFHKALDKDSNNVYAAHGLAVCLAELGELEKAKNIFYQVREKCNIPELLVNQAHILMVQQNYPHAITLYEKALRRLPESRHGDVPMYLANALYQKGDYERCKVVLTKALAMNIGTPGSDLWWFNLALTQKKQAHVTMKLDQKALNEDQVQVAIDDVTCALKTFRRLEKSGKESFLRGKAANHREFCEKWIKLANHHLEYHRKRRKKQSAEQEKEAAKVREEREKEIQAENEQKLAEYHRRKEIEDRALKLKQEAKQTVEESGAFYNRQRDDESRRRKRQREDDHDVRFSDDEALPEDLDTRIEREEAEMEQRGSRKRKLRTNEHEEEQLDLFGDDQPDGEPDELAPPPKKKKKKEEGKEVSDEYIHDESLWTQEELEVKECIAEHIQQICDTDKNQLKHLKRKDIKVVVKKRFGKKVASSHRQFIKKVAVKLIQQKSGFG